MSRPKPTIIREFTDPRTYISDQILKADAIYAVFYEGKPFNLKTVNTLDSKPSAKYRKSSFSNPGHAFNLAERLNKQFRTDKFTVHELVAGKEIIEHDPS